MIERSGPSKWFQRDGNLWRASESAFRQASRSPCASAARARASASRCCCSWAVASFLARASASGVGCRCKVASFDWRAVGSGKASSAASNCAMSAEHGPAETGPPEPPISRPTISTIAVREYARTDCRESPNLAPAGDRRLEGALLFCRALADELNKT